MRRIVVGFMSTVSALVLLFSYHTSLGSSNSSQSLPAAGGDPNTPSSGAADADPSASTGTGSSKRYTGDAVDTRWGVVQVRITVKNGKITKSEAVQYPTENRRDREINAYAVPQLNSEVVDQQSGGIDAVSGATVTSNGYLQSLQSAIDQAGL